jgi:MoaA/NifB/PqqE/SkfB family radical SAM enzyme
VFNEDIAKCLKKTNTLLLISVDGDEETHDSFRGKGAFRRAVENIKKYQSRGIQIRINFLIQKKNLDKIDYIYSLAKELKVSRLFYIFIAPQGRAYKNREFILSNEEKFEYLEKIKTIKRNSEVPFITIQDYAINYHSCFLIDHKGDVISQGYSDDECFNVGNLLKDGLQKVWNNPVFNHKGHFLQYAYMFNYYM